MADELYRRKWPWEDRKGTGLPVTPRDNDCMFDKVPERARNRSGDIPLRRCCPGGKAWQSTASVFGDVLPHTTT